MLHFETNMKFLLHALFIACAFLNCRAAKILVVFPVGSHSHFTLGFRLAKELVDRGHQVTFMSPYPQKTPIRNMTEISLAQIIDGVEDIKKELLYKLGTMTYVKQLQWAAAYGEHFTEQALRVKEVQELLRSNETFDLVLLEHFVNEAMVIFQHKFRCPLVILAPGPTTVFNSHLFANPSSTAYVPNLITNFKPQMTLRERLKNFYYDIVGELFVHHVMIPGQNAVLQRSVPGAPNLRDILYNASFMLLTTHISLNPPFPLQPNIIEIGGYHVLPPKSLPKDLQEFLDNATEGVILFSMGSNLKSASFPTEKKEAILNVFSRLKQKVLWKFEKDLPGKPDNVKIMSWIPQRDVLAHPNVVVFITHVGLLGKTEAVYHGVPLLGVPVFWDQEKNIVDAVHQCFGLSVPFHSLTEEKFGWALNELLNNAMYRRNAKIRLKIMRDQPLKPLDRAVYWIEYAIRHQGAPHFKSAGLDLRWYQILMLDVILILLITVWAIITIISYVVRHLSNNKNKKLLMKLKSN